MRPQFDSDAGVGRRDFWVVILNFSQLTHFDQHGNGRFVSLKLPFIRNKGLREVAAPLWDAFHAGFNLSLIETFMGHWI